MEDLLRKLVAFPTTTGNAAAMHELLNFVAGFVEQRGMHVEWIESNGFESFAATTKPGYKTPKVLLAAHADVVAADDEMFSLLKENGAYIGRGVLDMKFAIAAYLQIIDEIQSNLQDYDIGLMITSDEEDGGRNGTAKLVDKGYIPQVCILPDGGDDWQIQTASKGILVYDISVTGKSSHGSRPWLGENALIKLVSLLDEISALFPKLQNPDTNTLSLTHMTGGGKSLTQIPSKARMVIDVRTVNHQEYARIHDEIMRLCKRRRATCTVISDGAPTSFSLDDPLIAPYAGLVTKVTDIPMQGFFTMGTSDARYFVPYGVPCILVYPLGGNHHAAGEWIDVNAFEQFKQITKSYLDEVAVVKKNATYRPSAQLTQSGTNRTMHQPEDSHEDSPILTAV